jgi:glutathione S-transferase
MITLHQFGPAFGLPNASPFCMKLETWLRMAGLPYRAPEMRLSALGRAPKGKMPYIIDGDKTISDSTFVIDYFLGDAPSTLDATAYAFLANLLWVPVESPLKVHARQYPQLEAYCRRMRERYYG